MRERAKRRNSRVSLLSDKGAGAVVDGPASQSTPQGGPGQQTQPPASDGAQPPTEGKQQTAPAWMAQLSPDLRTHADLTGFKTIGELGKAYIDLKGKQAGSVRIPGKDASEDDRKAFMAALGVPESATQYKIPTIELPKGLAFDAKGLAPYLEAFHKAGYTQEQLDVALKITAEQIRARDAVREEAIKADRAAAEKALRAEFGAEYEGTFSLIDRFLDKAVGKEGAREAIALLDKTGLGDHPLIIRILAAAANGTVREHSAPPDGSASMSGKKDIRDVFYPDAK